jgi:hypothetical protein
MALTTSIRRAAPEAWDRLIVRYGSEGPRFEKWRTQLLDELQSDDHDTGARAIARFAIKVLGLAADAPQATTGEHDAHWELLAPHRFLAFEVKLAPQRQRIVNADVEQAEGAVRALESKTSRSVRGVIVTPWTEADPTAIQRLDRVRLLQRQTLVDQANELINLLLEYRRGWGDAESRPELRKALQARLPKSEWLWVATERAETWIEAGHLK